LCISQNKNQHTKAGKASSAWITVLIKRRGIGILSTCKTVQIIRQDKNKDAQNSNCSGNVNTNWLSDFSKTCWVNTVRCSKQAVQASVTWNESPSAAEEIHTINKNTFKQIHEDAFGYKIWNSKNVPKIYICFSWELNYFGRLVQHKRYSGAMLIVYSMSEYYEDDIKNNYSKWHYLL
jgi:hypothetical protein